MNAFLISFFHGFIGGRGIAELFICVILTLYTISCNGLNIHKM